MSERAWSCAVLVSLALVAGSATARAQDPGDGRVVATVKDNWGVVPGALVRLTNAAGRTLTGTADGQGRVEFPDVPAGTWTARASLGGFVDSPEASVPVVAGREHAVDLVLSLVQFASEVTVTTANRRQELLLNVADPVVLIDSTQLADAGARSAKEALADQAGSGVQVNQGGGQGHVSINGIPNSGVLVLVDGRRVLGKDANGNFNLEDLDLAPVDRIEVVKGAGSALYGSDALGGVINIITRRSAPGFTNTTSLRAGSFGDARASDTIGYRRGEWGASLSGGYRTYDGFDLSERNPQTIGQPASIWRTGALNADYKPASWLQARLFGDYFRRSIEDYYFSGPTQAPSTVYNSRRRLTRQGLTPEADVLVSPSTSVSASFNAGKYDRREDQIFATRIVTVAPWIERNRELKLVGRQTWQGWGRAHMLQSGYEFRREELQRAGIQSPDAGAGRAERELNVGWVQQELSLTNALTVSAGARYDSYSDFGDRWSPKLSGVYAVGTNQRVRATWGKGFRAPFFGELYLSSPSFVGNPNLKPERSTTATAGYAWSSGRTQLSADYFHADVENGITFDLSKMPFTYANQRRYTSQGVNTSLAVTLPWGFAPQVSYTLTDREDDAGNAVGGLPRHAASVKVLWVDGRTGLRVNLRGQLFSEAEFDDGTSQPAYQLWAAQASKRFTSATGFAFTVFAQVDNLFDKDDIFRVNASGNPIPGDYQVWAAPRAFMAGMTIDLDR
jgi:outer membrane receptor for ferrienterochelin and colicins